MTHETSKVVDIRASLNEREAEIELLQQTFTAIGSELNLARVFEIAAERARTLIDAETVLIPVIDANGNEYTYRAGAGENADEIVGETLPLNFGICGWVFQNNKPWWLGVLDELNDEERTHWEKDAGTVILVPLSGKKGLLGGISAVNKIGEKEFSRRDFNLLQMFSSIVSVAIENAIAVKKIEESNLLKDNYRRQLAVTNKQLTESSKELEQLALYDSLTGLPNRSLFRDRLLRSIEQQGGTEAIGVILIDLDKFKNINDVLGHEKGDRLLKKISARFMEHVTAEETLARLGGDEFVVVIEQEEKIVLDRAREMLVALEVPFQIDGAKIVVNGSMGIAMYPQHGEDVSTLLKHADSAMYRAKDNKKGVVLYTAEEDNASLRQLTMVADLRKALDKNEFELFYQPQVVIESGQIKSVEALGRWRKSVVGEVSPEVFIHELEQAGLIGRYSCWLIETALAQAIVWEKASYPIRISVNISVQDLINPEFILELDRIIKNESNGRYLTFEITESLFLSEQERIVEVLDFIRDLGVELSIDDFGTGYSSLSRLKKLPVNELKIDRSFIADMKSQKDDKIIVKSIIDLAHNLGLVVVAEGVESDVIYQCLRQMGCDIVQGYYISKPVPVGLFEEFLRRKLSYNLVSKGFCMREASNQS